MPQVKNAHLTLDRHDPNVVVTFKNDAVFSEFERRLTTLGVTFRSSLELIGVDPPGSTTGSVFFSTVLAIDVTDGAGELSVPCSFSLTFSRTSLDEDPSGFLRNADSDTDEYRGRIRIHTIGLPPEFTPDVFTQQATLGLVTQGATSA
jgi:hypothetical protein